MCEIQKSTGNWDTRSVYQCTPCVEAVLEQSAVGPRARQLQDIGDYQAREAANSVCFEAYREYQKIDDPHKQPEEYYQRAYDNFAPKLHNVHRRQLETQGRWKNLGHFFKGLGLMFQDADHFLDQSIESIDFYLFGPREYLVAPPPNLYASDTQLA